MSTCIGIFLFDGAEELDWAGPWEVLGYWAQMYPNDEVDLFTFAMNSPVTCAKGLRVLPDRLFDDVGGLDVLLVPGGIGTRALIEDSDIKVWLKSLSAAGTLMTSVCTGSLVFAATGLLDGRPATTYHSRMDLLGSLGTDIELRPQDRFVDDGDVVTAAGVSAGIDMALHLVARLHSVERAREVRRGIQYDPEPPV